MKNIAFAFSIAIIALSFFSVSGCVQIPTEKQSIVDLRPQISFKVDKENLLTARVELDGLDVGQVSDYLEGMSSMRIRPGTHVVRVISGSGALLEERFYLGDGANRAFIVR